MGCLRMVLKKRDLGAALSSRRLERAGGGADTPYSWFVRGWAMDGNPRHRKLGRRAKGQQLTPALPRRQCVMDGFRRMTAFPKTPGPVQRSVHNPFEQELHLVSRKPRQTFRAAGGEADARGLDAVWVRSRVALRQTSRRSNDGAVIPQFQPTSLVRKADSTQPPTSRARQRSGFHQLRRGGDSWPGSGE